MTIAVHDAGILAEVYDGDHGLAHSEREERRAGAALREAQIFNNVIDRLKARAAALDHNQHLRLLIYAHGGMVSHEEAILDSERLAPYMLEDNYVPLFLVWTSDFASSYGNRLCCVRDGREDQIWNGWFGPARLFGDVVSGVGRAPETYGKEVLRLGRTMVPAFRTQDYQLSERDFRSDRDTLTPACNATSETPEAEWNSATVIFPPYCETRPLNDGFTHFTSREASYYLLLPTETVTVLAQGAGASAWDNMVRRTRMAFRPSPAFVTQERTLAGNAPLTNFDCRHFTDVAAAEAYSGDTPEGRAGAFERFFARLYCETRVDTEFGRKLYVHFYGHSMGAIVGDEFLSRFPNFNYQRVVYMAAADTIRNFSNGALPVIQSKKVYFFNLMLHPRAESMEQHAGGLVPHGSLLEWIDEMFENSRSPDDHTLGKWNNVREAHQYFPPEAMSHMVFRVFPLQRAAWLDECGDLVGADPRWRRLPRCHPIEHGEFNHFAFWRERYLWGQMACEALRNPAQTDGVMADQLGLDACPQHSGAPAQ